MAERVWHIKECQLLSRLTDKQLARLERLGRMRVFSRNSTIYMPSDAGDGVFLLEIKLSHQDPASIIGATRETVTVLLGEMQLEGLLHLRRQEIVVAMIAGTLPADLMQRIQTHLNRFVDCQALLEKMKADADGKSMTSTGSVPRLSCGCRKCRSTLFTANPAHAAGDTSRRIALRETLDGNNLLVETR